jgi:hypothetical protein
LDVAWKPRSLPLEVYAQGISDKGAILKFGFDPYKLISIKAGFVRRKEKTSAHVRVVKV